MLDRKAKLILAALILVMLGTAVWRVAHAAHGSVMPFVIPAEALVIAGMFVVLARKLKGSADALAAWREWYSFFLVSCMAILAAFQLVPALRSLGLDGLNSAPLVRLLLAGYGVVIVVTGNRKPKLPPLDSRPAMRSLGKAREAAMLRLEGWLLVCSGLIITASALLLPIRLIAPVILSLALGAVAVILVRRHRLREQY